MKKLTTLLLALVAGAGTMFASNTQVDGIWYKFNNGNLTAEVTYQGADYTSYSNRYSGEVVIPSSVTYNAQTYTVTSIGTSAFDACTGLTSVTIPNSVTSIGNWAFWNCTGLTSVTIPNSVTSIGDQAFYYCSSLTSVTIGNSVTSIGEYAFWNCTGLTSVTIGNSVTSIGSSAFNGCTGLTSVTIPNSVTSIGNYAFQNCSSLTSVTIPNSVTSIGSNAFYGCSGLTSVTIPNSVTSIGSSAFYNVPNIVYSGSATGSPWGAKSVNGYVDGYLVYSDDTKTTLITCSSSAQGEIVIPNSVTSIGDEAFYGCSGLTSVTIPNSVTSIGKRAFERCTGLTSVTIPNSVTSIGSSAFYNVLNIVYSGSATGSPWGAKSVNGYVDGYLVYSDDTKTTLITCSSSAQGEIVIPNSVTSIGKRAFERCTGLTSVTIPSSVTSIGEYAFYNVLNIVYSGSATGSPWGAKSVNGYVDGYLVYSDDTKTTLITCSSSAQGEIVIPNSVTSIGDEAFYGCSGLTSVTIPNSVESIGGSAFYNCRGLTSVTIPNSVTSIGSEAFSGCNNITSVVWNAKNGSGYNFGSQVESFTFGDEVEVIPASICSGMDNLTSLTIPNSVTSIGSEAFLGCTGLTSLTIPNSVTSIGSDAFSGCNNITSVVWNAKNCGGWNFGSQVESFTFGDEVEVIPASICSGMNNLTSIAIPNSVTSIGREAFLGCTGLTSLTIPNNVTSIESFAFYGCSSLTSLTMGNSVASIGDYAFRYCSALSSVEAPAVFFDIHESQWSYYTKILSQVIVNGGELTENALQFIKRSYKTLRVMDVSEATNTEFADETFSGYYNLTNLKLPESLTSISYMMAAGCKNLESITIPESVEEIGQSAFEDCRSITFVDFGENPALTMIGSWAFYNCHELANIDIPEGVTEIGKAAFYGCAYAQAAHLPASLQYIGDNGFALCSKLTEMTVDAVTPPEVENKTFYEVSTEAPIYVPDQSVSAYKSHPVWSRLNIVGRNDIPTAIGDVQSNSQLPTANSQKILSNGQILILRDGNTYTIDGKKVEN